MSQIKLTHIRKQLLKQLGLNYTKNQEVELYRKLKDAAIAFGFENNDDFIEWLPNQELSKSQIEKLATFLTIGETYFFREKKALDYLEFDYLPKLIIKRAKSTKKLRIWSAACATGEEPYSIAIILKKIIPDIKNWDIKILATDINPSFIKKAKEGIYSKWSFRGNTQPFIANNFKQINETRYQINQEIKEMVTFSFINLASDTYPSSHNETSEIDVILCRNVMIYFSPKGIKSVTTKLYKSLKKDGVLAVSPVEVSSLICNKFNTTKYKGVTIYIKSDKKKAESINPISFTKTENPLDKTLQDFFDNQKDEKAVKRRINNLKIQIQKTDAIEREKKVLKAETIITKKEEAVLKKQKPETFGKALAFYKSGMIDKAEKLTNKIISLNNGNDHKSSLLLLARIKANRGELENSEKLCLKAIRIDKIDPESHYLLATILNEQGRDKDAKKALNNTLFLNPDFALGHFLLGNISLKKSDKVNSKKHFRNAIKSLSKLRPEEILTESDGLTAKGLSVIIETFRQS